MFLNDEVNGDGIEQNDKRFLAGNNINYRRNYDLWGLPMESFVGFQSRFDHIRVALFNQTNRRRREAVKDNYVDQTNLGWFVQQEIRSTSWLRTQIGARMDNFWYDVEQIGQVAEPISGEGFDLESELVFVGDEGTFEPSGPSNRHGIESELRYDILPWLSYDLDLSYTWARFVNGDEVPLAPRFLAFTGLTARHDSGLQGRLQMRHIGRRFGIEDGSIMTPTSTIFDLFLKYVMKRYELFLSFQNLANTKWRAAEHVFESRLSTEPSGVGTLDSHFTPGDAFTAKAGITVHLW